MAAKNEKKALSVERKHVEAPKNLMDVVLILAEAIMLLGYTESRHIFHLPSAIASAVLDKGKKTVARECGERSDCIQVKAPEVIKELYEIKRLLTRTMLFSSRKRFLGFLFAAGLDKEDVLLRKRSARILRPAFTVIRDIESKTLLVFIRGTRSLKDTLTDALCAPVPFEHWKNNDNKVSGHAHRGMVAASSWILKHSTPVLLDALRKYPHFKIKIVGHSLGGGTAALLTYKLREIQQFSSSTCLTFGPAACMTLELAEFGKPFIISLINGSDMVPTLSASSVHDFISEDRDRSNNDQNILTTVRSHLPIAKAIAEHAVTSCTEVVKKYKHGARALLPWHRHENIDTSSSSSETDNYLAEASESSETNFESLLSEEHIIMESMSDDDEHNSSSEGSDSDDDSDHDHEDDSLSNQARKLKLGKEEEEEEESDCPVTTSRRRRLYPPGRIMHIVPASAHSSENPNSNHNNGSDEKHVYLYETPRELYGKLRLSRGMILDHMTKKYLNMLKQLINQLEKESFKPRHSR